MTEEENIDQPLPLVAHLTELRDRLLRALLAVLVIFIVLFPFANDIYAFVSEPLRAILPEGAGMIATEVASPFLTPFKLTLISAIFIAIPYVLYQIWGFVAPGMYRHEKRLAIPLLVSSVLMGAALWGMETQFMTWLKAGFMLKALTVAVMICLAAAVYFAVALLSGALDRTYVKRLLRR